MGSVKRVGIVGVGSHLPPKILTNFDLEKMVETSDEWIVQRTGIRARRLVEDGVATSDLATEAARKALKSAGLKPEDIELVAVGTVTPDYAWPAAACVVQKKMGLVNAAAFDISAGCTGFIYNLSMCVQAVATGYVKNALVIGAECLSRITDYTDRNTCVLFADGAGAAIITETDGRGEILFSKLYSDGRGDQLMWQPGGGSLYPASHETIEKRLHYIKLQGREVFKFVVEKMPELINEACKAVGITPNDIRWIIPHQVNYRILEYATERLGMPMNKVYLNLDKYGNTSSASIPIALDEVVTDGKIARGDIVVMVAFGAGCTWGSVVMRW